MTENNHHCRRFDRIMMEAVLEADEIVFNCLKKGDTLKHFGRNDMIVEKKNDKSVIVDGARWSLLKLQNI